MSAPTWAADYIGIPYAAAGRDRSGCDCYGLVRLILVEQFGQDLPLVPERYATDRQAREDMTRVRSTALALIPSDELALGQEQPGDIINIRVLGQPLHVGVVAAPGWMLHAQRGVGAALESYMGSKWAPRVLGFYRPRRAA